MSPRATTAQRYEIAMVAILGLAVGVKTFEQTSSSYLMPFIQPDLHLTNTQVGLIVSVYYMTYAISSCIASTLADLWERRKILVVAVMGTLSLCSVLSGFASSFALLLLARLLMGVLEGPMLPITQSIIALESPSQRRGTNMGLVGSLFANIFGLFVAPLVLVRLATHFNWRAGFFVVILPGLICTLLTARLIREPATGERDLHGVAPAKAKSGGNLIEALRFRNVWVCGGLCAFFAAFYTVGLTFLPLYYVNFRQFSAQQTSFLLGLVGISSIVFATLVPMASDRIGRKPVIVAASLLSTLGSWAVIYYNGSMAVLAVFLFVGWTLLGTGSLLLSTIPSESVPARSISSAMGLVMAIGVLAGGLAGPTVAGWSADHWGLRAPLLVQVGCAMASTLLSLALLETAPCKVKASTVQLAAVLQVPR